MYNLRRGVTLTIAVSALVLLALAAAAAVPVGTEFQVNTDTNSDQQRPALAADADGNFVVVWESTSSGPDYAGIFGQRYDSGGSAVDYQFKVDWSWDDQQEPAVAADADGDFVVVWQQPGMRDGDSFGVFGQRYDSGGTEQGAEFQVNTYTTSLQKSPAVATDADGDFVVVWESNNQDGNENGIFGQRYDSAGSALGTEFQVNTYTTSLQKSPAVAAAADGAFMVVWQSWNQDGSSSGVFGQRYDSAGSALGTEFQVNTYTTGFQQSQAVATDADGNFVVVWESIQNGQDGSYGGIFGQRYDSSGTKQATEFQVNTYTTSTQVSPAVAADADGDFVVVWSSGPFFGPGGGQDGDVQGVFGQRYDSGGTKLGAEFQVNTYTTSWQHYPAVAADADGDFVVVWESYLQDGWGDGVFGQRFVEPMVICPAVPASGCDTPGKSILILKDKDEDGPGLKDKLTWKWIKGPATLQADFGDPTSTATCTFCLYHGASPTVAMTARVAPGGTCDGKDCWKPISTKGYKFKDKLVAQDGIFRIVLKGHPTKTNSKILVKGKDGGLTFTAANPLLDDSDTISVRLSNSDNANCWGADFAPGDVVRNTAKLFKAKTVLP